MLEPGVGLALVAPRDQLPDGAPWSPWSARHAVNIPQSARLVVRRGFITSSFSIPARAAPGATPSHMEHNNFRHPARKLKLCFSATCAPFCKSGSTPTANSLYQHETVRLKFESG